MAAADTKRHSVAGKGPAPGTGPGAGGPLAMVSLESALSGAIGARIRITTAAPASSTVEGILFTACPITNILAINVSPNTSSNPSAINGDYRIIPISRIQSFQLLSLNNIPEPNPSSFATATPPIHPVDLRPLRAREASAIAKAQSAEQRRGKGVSKEAQDIFDAFARTMPVRWDGVNIIVSDAVVIAKPYTVADCRLVTGVENAAALTRVMKVLEMEKKKIELRNESAKIRVPAVPNLAGQRKGG